MSPTHTSLTGKVVIVTGAGRGIGRSIALAVAAKGAHVALAARSADQLATVCAEILDAGGEGTFFPTDMRSEDEVRGLADHVVAHFGRLDAVVNNAGIGLFGPLAETSTDAWEETMAVNARGPFILCREAIPHLKKQAVSHVINITSVVGVKGYVNQSAYSASKHAVMGMTKALAREVQADGQGRQGETHELRQKRTIAPAAFVVPVVGVSAAVAVVVPGSAVSWEIWSTAAMPSTPYWSLTEMICSPVRAVRV